MRNCGISEAGARARPQPFQVVQALVPTPQVTINSGARPFFRAQSAPPQGVGADRGRAASTPAGREVEKEPGPPRRVADAWRGPARRRRPGPPQETQSAPRLAVEGPPGRVPSTPAVGTGHPGLTPGRDYRSHRGGEEAARRPAAVSGAQPAAPLVLEARVVLPYWPPWERRSCRRRRCSRVPSAAAPGFPPPSAPPPSRRGPQLPQGPALGGGRGRGEGEAGGGAVWEMKWGRPALRPHSPLPGAGEGVPRVRTARTSDPGASQPPGAVPLGRRPGRPPFPGPEGPCRSRCGKRSA